MIHALALMLVLAPAPVDPPRRPDGTDVWAIGFAMSVVRNCSGWTMQDQRHLHARGILPKVDFGSPRWRQVEDDVRAGMSAAETMRSGHPRMCENLPALDALRWQRLSPILRRSPKPSSANR